MQTVFKSLDDLPAMLAVKDVMQLFDMGRRQAYELVHSEGFPAINVGSSIKIPKHLLVGWVEAQAKKGVSNQC